VVGRLKGADPRPIVLVAGACLGGWAWADVAARLRALGHDVYPVTLTGLGERVHLAHPDVDLETHVADVVNLLDYEALDDAVLVGHSYAGTVVTAVADRRPQRLDAVVYLDTSPLPDATAIVDVQSPQQQELQRSAVHERGEGWSWPAPDRQTILAGTWGSASGLRDEHLQLIAQRATAQPYATMTSPVRLVHRMPPGVRRAAIFCTAGGIDVASLRELIARGDPRAATFADNDWELHDLPTGHWAMFSLPGPLADLLDGIAQGPRRD
jgi:pimeloyl-ACP methyl ester carboxylesterase